jgi:hypothetical protein
MPRKKQIDEEQGYEADKSVETAVEVEEKEAKHQEQEFAFPEHRITIKASTLEEAKKKLHEELKKHKTL